MHKKDKKQGPKALESLGKHLFIDVCGCAPEVLIDLNGIRDLMVATAKAAKATIVKVIFGLNETTGGVSGAVIISESHLAIHTLPGKNAAVIDVFTCGNIINPRDAANFIIERLKPLEYSIQEALRGEAPPDVSWRHKPQEAEIPVDA